MEEPPNAIYKPMPGKVNVTLFGEFSEPYVYNATDPMRKRLDATKQKKNFTYYQTQNALSFSLGMGIFIPSY